jgi:uncharacterized tellurite resistance protein B-like protein
MNTSYNLGLLNLAYLLISADGVIDEKEKQALKRIKENEAIPDDVFNEFEKGVLVLKERDIYQTGIDNINLCSDTEKIRAFVILYKLSEVDGHVHAKEVRLLLYSIKSAFVEFDDVVSEAKKLTSFF